MFLHPDEETKIDRHNNLRYAIGWRCSAVNLGVPLWCNVFYERRLLRARVCKTWTHLCTFEGVFAGQEIRSRDNSTRYTRWRYCSEAQVTGLRIAHRDQHIFPFDETTISTCTRYLFLVRLRLINYNIHRGWFRKPMSRIIPLGDETVKIKDDALFHQPRSMRVQSNHVNLMCICL